MSERFEEVVITIDGKSRVSTRDMAFLLGQLNHCPRSVWRLIEYSDGALKALPRTQPKKVTVERGKQRFTFKRGNIKIKKGVA